MKKIAAIVLCAAMLVLPFALHAGAVGDSAYAPVITMQPKAAKNTVQVGKELMLEAEAKLPDGAEGTLSYAWYAYYSWAPELDSELTPIATGAKVSIPITQDMIGI